MLTITTVNANCYHHSPAGPRNKRVGTIERLCAPSRTFRHLPRSSCCCSGALCVRTQGHAKGWAPVRCREPGHVERGLYKPNIYNDQWWSPANLRVLPDLSTVVWPSPLGRQNSAVYHRASPVRRAGRERQKRLGTASSIASTSIP